MIICACEKKNIYISMYKYIYDICMIGIPHQGRGNLHPVITGTFEIVQQVVSGGS